MVLSFWLRNDICRHRDYCSRSMLAGCPIGRLGQSRTWLVRNMPSYMCRLVLRQMTFSRRVSSCAFRISVWSPTVTLAAIRPRVSNYYPADDLIHLDELQRAQIRGFTARRRMALRYQSGLFDNISSPRLRGPSD